MYIEGCNYDGRFVFETLPPDTLIRYHVWRTEKTLEAYYTQRLPAVKVRQAAAGRLLSLTPLPPASPARAGGAGVVTGFLTSGACPRRTGSSPGRSPGRCAA